MLLCLKSGSNVRMMYVFALEGPGTYASFMLLPVIIGTWVNVQNFQNPELQYQNLKLAVCLQNIKNPKINGQIPLDKLKLNQKSYHYLQNSAF